MSKIEAIQDQVQNLRTNFNESLVEIDKAVNKNNKSAATRARKHLQELIVTAKALRAEILNLNK